jgi:subtilisin family serine protease
LRFHPAVSLSIFLALSITASAPADFLPGRLLVEVDPNDTVDTSRKTLELLDGKLIRSLAGGRYLELQLPDGTSPHKAARTSKSLPGVISSAPVIVRRLAVTPNDPLFAPNQWSFHNTGGTITFPDPGDPTRNITLTAAADADIDAPEAWAITTGSSSVVVAVIDTGFPVGHLDLMPNVWINPNEVAGNGIDDDGNGYVDDLYGWNFAQNNSNVNDTHGHGSFCSGIIGARGSNGLGMAGINWHVSIMGLKAFKDDGTATDVELVAAIDYAIANGAHVINASWGDYLDSEVLRGAIRRAADAGILFVAASGNDRYNLKENPMYPASMNLPNIINVGATDSRDRWAEFSNYDGTLVDAHAPGYWVFSARPNKYEHASGTSFAAPHVAGIAALLLAAEPTLTLDELRARVVTGFDRRDSLLGRGATSGRSSAHRVLANAAQPGAEPTPINDLEIIQTASNGFELQFTTPPGNISHFDIRASKSEIDPDNFHAADRVFFAPLPSTPVQTQRFLATELEPDTTYHFMIRTYEQDGRWTFGNPASATTLGRTIYFQDDMETGPEKWEVSGPFARTDETSAGGNWSWTDSPGGNYARNTITTITSTPIDLSSAIDPWLSFQHQHVLARSFTTVGDNGSVQVSIDGANTFTTLAVYIDTAHPFRLARVSLGAYAGQPDVRIRFRFRSDGFERVADGWHIDDVEVAEFVSLLPEPADFVVESATRLTTVTAAPAYIETNTSGSWFTSVSKATLAQLRGARSRYKVLGNSPPGSTARFTPRINVAGRYEVFVAWGDNANASNVTHRVHHAAGVSEILLTQDYRNNAHRWHSLGTYSFGVGRSAENGSVVVDDTTSTTKPIAGEEGRVYADSVRWLWRGPLETGPSAGWMVH